MPCKVAPITPPMCLSKIQPSPLIFEKAEKTAFLGLKMDQKSDFWRMPKMTLKTFGIEQYRLKTV